MTRTAAVVIIAVLLTALLLSTRAGAQEAALIRVRFSTSPEKVRVVLDLSQEAVITDQSTPTQPAVLVGLPLEKPLPTIAVTDPIVTRIEVGPDEGGNARLTITLTKARKCRVFTLPPADGRPFRAVVDVLKLFSVEETRELTPAITYLRVERQTEDRYLAAHVVTINANDPRVRFEVSAADGTRERVAAMAARLGAVCGVNGGYFLAETRPVGLLKTGRAVLSLPLWGRTAVAFPPSGSPILGSPRGVWQVALPDGRLLALPDRLDASAQTPLPAAAVISGATQTQAPANPGGLTVVIRGGVVAALTTEQAPLARADFAVLLTGDQVGALGPAFPEGQPAAITPALTPAWEEFPHAVGGGPRLLRGGVVVITGRQERFGPDILNGRHARTALGTTKDGRVILAVVEGPGPYGGGATLEELALLLKARGAVEAMNLDGGSSSSLAIGADTVNYPPGTWIRPVASAILLFDERWAPPAPTPTPPDGTNGAVGAMRLIPPTHRS